jgi:hypothetical protein
VRQQGRPATVGDTITVVHRVAAPPGAVVQVRSPLDTTIATLVGAPLVTREGDSVRIAYTISVWAPGHNDLVLPGPIVIGMNGRVDTLETAHVALDVASLLPSGLAPNKVAPRQATTWVPRAEMSVLPFLVLVPLVLIVLGVVHWRWRRRGQPAPIAKAATAVLVDRSRLDRWLAAGEAGLALEHLEGLTRDQPALDEWRNRVDAVRFAPCSEEELVALVHEGCERAGIVVS